MAIMWTDELTKRVVAEAAARKAAKQQRATDDDDLAAVLGATTRRQRWTLYWVTTAMFLAAMVNLVTAVAAGDLVGGIAAGFIMLASGWAVVDMGDGLGLGPQPDPEPVQRPLGGPGKSAAL